MPDVPEDYYYSSLEAEEIEDRLLHMVTYHKTMHLSDDEKALFRTNIGAGTTNTGLIILGYFDTLEDLRESLTVLPKAGDAYGIGTSAPYDIYVYDGYHAVWINNGPLNPGGTTFDDSTVSSSKGWTSNKVSMELATKQATLTFDSAPTSGSTRPVTSGGVYTAITGIPKYSPVRKIETATYNISSADIGATIAPTYAMRSTAITVMLTQAISTTLPVGTEIAILNDHNSNVTLSTSGIAVATPGNVADGPAGYNTKNAHSFKAAEPFSMLGLKKMTGDSSGDSWLLTGNVEVVS